MNNCLECGNETKNKKFCSQSCSATYNNKGVRRNYNPERHRKCLNCKTDTTNPKYCSMKCHHEYERKLKNDEIRKDKGTVPAGAIKKYLIEEHGNQCMICGIKEWQGKPLVMICDHIDGNSENNKLKNLRLLCSNCDSQLPTYKSKNKNGRFSRKQRYADGKSY